MIICFIQQFFNKINTIKKGNIIAAYAAGFTESSEALSEFLSLVLLTLICEMIFITTAIIATIKTNVNRKLSIFPKIYKTDAKNLYRFVKIINITNKIK